jgi:curli biogenesis system outer membrane secretion channel CsgG
MMARKFMAVRWCFCLALLVFVSGSARCQLSTKRRVAVLDFDTAAAQAGSSAAFLQTNPADVGKGITGLLVAKLVQDGQVSVIERDAIAKVLAEQNLSNSNRADPTTAAKLGRLLGVDALILGTITHYEYDERMKGTGSSLHMLVPWTRGAPSYKGKYDAKAKVQISTRLVSPDTAEVVLVCDGVGESNQKNIKTDLRDAGGRIARGAGVNTPVMSDAIDKAVAQLVAQLEPVFAKLPQHLTIVEGLVADVSNSGRLVLNVGANNGLKIGDHLEVLRVAKEIRDPVTGKLLTRDDTPLGEAIIISVGEQSAVAQYSGTEPAKVEDLVRSIPAQH